MDLNPQDAIETTGGGPVGILMKVPKRFGISLTYSYLCRKIRKKKYNRYDTFLSDPTTNSDRYRG